MNSTLSQAEITKILMSKLDKALSDIGHLSIVSASEMIDILLDIRLLALSLEGAEPHDLLVVE